MNPPGDQPAPDLITPPADWQRVDSSASENPEPPPKLITAAPRSKSPQDTSPSTWEVAAHLHTIDVEKREAAEREMGARRKTHENFLHNQPGVKALEKASEPIELGDHLVFAKTDDGAIESPLRFPFRDYHLPPAPNWVEPLAVVLTGQADGVGVRSAMLVVRREGAIEKLFLEDNNLRADTKNPKWDWQVPGNARLSSESYKMIKTDENEDLLTVQLDWEGYGGEQPPENIRIVRGDLSQAEKAFMDVEATEKQRRILSGIGKIAGAVGLAAILSNMAPAPADEMPERKVLEVELERPGNNEAAQRIAQNLEAFKSGDLETLKRNFENTEFAKPVVDQAVFDKIDHAKSLDEITGIMDSELEQYGTDFRILRDSVEADYNGMSEGDLDLARSTALGTLDGLNNLRAIGINGEDYDIAMVKDVFYVEDGSVESAGGKYYAAWNGEKAVVMVGATNRPLGARVVEHEVGHHVLPRIEAKIENLNPEDGEYRKDPYGKKTGKGNLVAGRNVATNYGGESRKEDAAELLETAVGQNIGIDPFEDNILQEKYITLLLDIERRDEGASAFILHNALTHQKLAEDAAESAVLGVLEIARENASHALLLAGLTLAVGGGLARENQKLVDRQIRAGLRPRRIYKQPRRVRRQARLKKP